VIDNLLRKKYFSSMRKALHFTSFCTFFAGFDAGFAAFHRVFATFGNAGFAAFDANSAQSIRKFGLAGAQSGAQSADVGTIAANSHTSFVSWHIETIRCAFFAINNASQASVNTVFYISHF
jgi:hypothetical protein